MNQDLSKLVERVDWRLEKYDGDPPKPGEKKLPVEVIEGGDGRPTVVSYPQKEFEDGNH